MTIRFTPYLRYETDDLIASQFVLYDANGDTIGVYNTGEEATIALRAMTLEI